jgi:putative photosynthetic complex assembly protein
MGAIHDQPVPRGALLGAAALIGVSLLAVTAARIEKALSPPPPVETVADIEARSVSTHVVQFRALSDGRMEIVALATGRVLETLPAGDIGFIRGILRALSREHKVNAVNGPPTVRLTQWKDGRLTLDDLATGQRIDLRAFGHDNAKSFSALLAAAEQAS